MLTDFDTANEESRTVSCDETLEHNITNALINDNCFINLKDVEQY